MTDLEARIETLERAVTEGEHDLSDLASEADALNRLSELETTCEDLEAQLAELEAATQAVRGYVGSIRAVNAEVEQRADAALAAVESLEQARETAGVPKHRSTTTEANQVTQKQHAEKHSAMNQSKHQSSCCVSCGRPQQSPETAEQTSDGIAVSDGGSHSDSAHIQREKQWNGLSEQPEKADKSEKEPGTLSQIRKLL